MRFAAALTLGMLGIAILAMVRLKQFLAVTCIRSTRRLDSRGREIR